MHYNSSITQLEALIVMQKHQSFVAFQSKSLNEKKSMTLDECFHHVVRTQNFLTTFHSISNFASKGRGVLIILQLEYNGVGGGEIWQSSL